MACRSRRPHHHRREHSQEEIRWIKALRKRNPKQGMIEQEQIHIALDSHCVFSRNGILDSVWGESFFGSARTVDTYVKSLRGKIRPCHQNCIETVWGLGYRAN